MKCDTCDQQADFELSNTNNVKVHLCKNCFKGLSEEGKADIRITPITIASP